MIDAFIRKNVKLSLEFDDYLAKHPTLFKNIPTEHISLSLLVATRNSTRIVFQSSRMRSGKRSLKLINRIAAGLYDHSSPKRPSYNLALDLTSQLT